MAAFTRPTKIALLAAITIATLWPADLLAQRRVSRRTSGHSVVVVGARPYYYPYYSPFYSGFYSPFYWSPYAQYPYPYPYYGGWAWDNTGSARLQIAPRNARVYVDGYFVGVVDDFDGSLQRLNVEAGEHELQVYLDGYRPFTLKVLFARGRTVKIAHALEPLAPGETAPPPPRPSEAAGPDPTSRESYRAGPQRQGPPPRAGEAQAQAQSQFGSLLLRVRPADAQVLVDGEAWDAPSGEDQFVIELSEGQHRIEVTKSGFQTYSTLVRVRRGETVRLNVSLTAGGLSEGF